MTFSISIQTSDAYYKEAYTELLSLKKLKKFEPVLAVVMIVFGVALYASDTQRILGIFPFIFTLVGLYEFFKFYYDKYKWFKQITESKTNNSNLHLAFDELTIRHIGPISRGEFSWAAVKAIKETSKGIILTLERKSAIYIPKASFANRGEIEFLLSRDSA